MIMSKDVPIAELAKLVNESTADSLVITAFQSEDGIEFRVSRDYAGSRKFESFRLTVPVTTVVEKIEVEK